MQDIAAAFTAAQLVSVEETLQRAKAKTSRIFEPRRETAPMPKLWFLIRMHPNYDLKAERQLHERGISAYVPKEKTTVRSAWTRRVQKTVPIFPGAMFIPDFDADIQKLKDAADGIGGFVKYCGEALKVSLKTLEEVRNFERWRNGLPMQRKYKPGQKICITRGPFALWEGKIDRLDRNFRISVLIEILGREVRLELDEDQVAAV